MLDERLHASGLAAYRWGTLLLETSALAPVTGDTVVRAMAAAAAGGLNDSSASGIRATIAVLHELVHLQQDLSTGLGAWDHITTRTAYVRLNSQARWFVMKFTDPPYAAAVDAGMQELSATDFVRQMRQDLDAIRKDTVALRQISGGTWLTPEVLDRVSDLFGQHPVELLEEYSLRSLLECEAACSVHQKVAAWRFTEDGAAHIDDHRALWNVLAMGEPYISPLLALATAVSNGPPDAEHVVAALPFYLEVLGWAVDLACAYPPPSVLNESSHRADFDPVLKFVCIARTLNELDEGRTKELSEAIAGERFAEAEVVLSTACPVPYPPSREIYERWLEHLESLAAEDAWDAPLFKLRADAIRARLGGGGFKGLAGMLEAQTPVQVLVDGTGIRGVLHGNQFDDDNLKQGLLMRSVDVELFDLFYGNGTFRCPLARAALCDARTKRCVNLTRVEEFPNASGCWVRRQLEDMGYAI